MRRVPIGAVILVLAVYIVCSTVSMTARGGIVDRYYASLSEGFLRGQLSMAAEPHPRLAQFPEPWDPNAKKRVWAYDASFKDGRYYLYFTPVAPLLFYIPARLIAGTYPRDQLAALFFGTWAFVMLVAFTRRALAMRGRELFVPMALWTAFLGLATMFPYVLARPRIYEVAAVCGAAMSATWLWSLLRVLESPTASRIVWCAIWLGLAVAARPTLGVLVFVGFAAVFLATRRWKPLIAMFVPLAIIGSTLLAYNYARFDDPLEFGHRYQLNHLPMFEISVFGFQSTDDVERFVHHAGLYLFAPPVVSGEFPFVRLDLQELRGRTYRPVSEEMGGIVPLAPIAVIGSLLALGIAWRRRGPDRGPAETAALLAVAGAWLAILGVSAFWYVVARYELDFLPLMAAGAVVCIESTLGALSDAGRRIAVPRACVIALVVYSIVIGAMLGLR